MLGSVFFANNVIELLVTVSCIAATVMYCRLKTITASNFVKWQFLLQLSIHTSRAVTRTISVTRSSSWWANSDEMTVNLPIQKAILLFVNK